MKSDRIAFFSLPLAILLGASMAGPFGGITAAAQQSHERGQQARQSTRQPASASQRTKAEAPELNELRRSCYQICDRALQKLQSRGRDMAHATAAPVINLDTIRSNRDQIREQLATLEQHRTQLHAGLDEQQRSAVQERMQELSRLHVQIQERLTAIDGALDAPALDRHRLTEEARLTERAIHAYQLHFQQMGDELGFNLD